MNIARTPVRPYTHYNLSVGVVPHSPHEVLRVGNGKAVMAWNVNLVLLRAISAFIYVDCVKMYLWLVSDAQFCLLYTILVNMPRTIEPGKVHSNLTSENSDVKPYTQPL